MKDVHGDTTSLVRNNTEIGTYDYDAYGNLMESTGTQDNPFRYCGEYFDEETGFIYLRNRYYDPSIQRFISEDPAQDGTNWYAYCDNNPVMYVDPWGLDSWVFYDATNYGEQAKSEAETLKNIYGTDVHLVDIWSIDGFAYNWNLMAETDNSIDGVSLLFHGSPYTLYFGVDWLGNAEQLTSSTQSITPNTIDKKNTALYVGNLTKVTMHSLNILSCNGGHIDHIYGFNEQFRSYGFNHNIAVEFLVTHNISYVYAWDGSLSYTKIFDTYIPRLAFDQSRFFEMTPSNFINSKRMPIGHVTYWLNDDGELILYPY